MGISKQTRQQVFEKYNGLCAYTGKPLDDKWQVDHVTPRIYFFHRGIKTGHIENPDDISNLLPAIRIVNHYKRDHSLESFRRYMLSFHLRLKKLPKKTVVERTKGRIEYLNKIAVLFEITPDKPFAGKFYFESNPLTNINP